MGVDEVLDLLDGVDDEHVLEVLPRAIQPIVERLKNQHNGRRVRKQNYPEITCVFDPLPPIPLWAELAASARRMYKP